MSNNSANNKLVAKNTIILYFRMLLLMGVGFYTSRVVLQVLGVEDYGIQNVVAGFLSMFGIITSSMSAAISRFITVELGKGELNRLKAVFATSIAVQLAMAVILIIAIESFGYWFVSHKMNIPLGREDAALWCLHCATITTLLNLINVPYNSAIIAHEKMSVFAYLSILDAVLKLVICYVISISPFDKLNTYATLLVVVSCVNNLVYLIYCHTKFAECRFKLSFNKTIFKEIWGFAGWSFFGNTAWILNNQGVNMLMNIFHGVVVNAARGIASQVDGIINKFVTNYMMALNPQITKTYAAGNKQYAFALACRGARFSFYILLFLALPIMIEADKVLSIWLGTPPDQSANFFIWTVVSSLIMTMGNTLVTLQNAHGNIKHYQIWITIFGYIPFPATWIVFKLLNAPAIWAYFIFTLVYWFLLFVRFYLVHQSTGIPAKQYLTGVVLKCHIVGFLSAILPILIHFLMEESFLRLILVGLVSVVSSGVVIYFYGMEPSERTLVMGIVKKFTSKLHK